MTDLIERLEAATGPDRELDAAIFAAVYPDKVPSPIVESGYGWRYDKRHWWLATGEDSRVMPKMVTPERYTASIDAALTLAGDMNETRLWHLWHDALSRCSKAEAHIVRDLPRFICIAALHAKGEV